MTSHPLIQEAAYAELAEIVRQRTHATFAAVLERLDPGAIEHLARHYRGAGSEAEPARGLEVFLAAGARARGLHAHEDATRHFGAALALVQSARARLEHAELASNPDAAREALGTFERLGARRYAGRA
jgi:predicted ATPase